jgi:Fe-S-cluster containining protein
MKKIIEDKKMYHMSQALSQVIHSRPHTPEQQAEIRLELDFYIDEYQKHRKGLNPRDVAFGFQNEVDKCMEDFVANSPHGKDIKCGMGCSFCCRTNVDINIDEAQLLVDFATEENIVLDIERLKKQQDKDDETWKELVGKDRRCVFLGDDENCKAYKYRPAVCRKHVVVSDPKDCDMETNFGGQTLKGFHMKAELLGTAMYNAVESGNMAKMILKTINNNNQKQVVK